MKISAWKAWAYGAVIVLIASVLPSALIICDKLFDLSRIGRVLSILILLSGWMPAMAAFVVGYLAPCRKITLGISMAFLDALFSIIIGFSYQILGIPTDSIGITAEIILFAISLVTSVALCGAGAVLGAVANREKLELTKN